MECRGRVYRVCTVDSSDDLDDCVRRVTVIGQADGQPDAEQTWLVFSKAMHTSARMSWWATSKSRSPSSMNGCVPSPVHRWSCSSPRWSKPILGSACRVHICTTPSRDNVPHRDGWNQGLRAGNGRSTGRCTHMASRQAICSTWMFSGACRSIRRKFDAGSMFAPLHEGTKQALISRRLLPRFGGGYLAAGSAKLARTQELRELFDSEQLARLFSVGGKMAWLSGEISQDRTPELRRYLMDELQVVEVTPATILPKLNAAFLGAQNDEWVCSFYEFLNSQTALRRQAANLPLVRLTDGTHVQARVNGRPQAFLPGEIETGFPTVRAAVCDSEGARAFLGSLGLTKPDPVDDVVRNVLRKYEDAHDVGDDEYADDIRRILNAFRIDSREQRDKLVAALHRTPFVMVVDAGDGSRCSARPGDLYLATDRLKKLFAGIAGIKLLDDGCATLRGENVRTLLEACGATRHLEKQDVECRLPPAELSEIRRQAGLERSTWGHRTDATLRGIDPLLNSFADMGAETRRIRSGLLWEALVDLANRNTNAFLGQYTWRYAHEQKTAHFDAAFVRRLNETPWIPDGNGKLQRPESGAFSNRSAGHPIPSCGQKLISNRQSLIDLPRKPALNLQMLDMLKRLGITSEAELIARLGLPETASSEGGSVGPITPDDAITALLGDMLNPTPPVTDPEGVQGALTGSAGDRTGTLPAGGRASATGGHGGSERNGLSGGLGRGGGKGTSGTGRERSFISYVTVHHDDEESDPDGLEHAARMALEETAVNFILSRHPNWKRAPTHNPDFDLYESGPDGNPVRWCEVKAMTGSLDDRPVGLSRPQFGFACKHRADYWLYVVERAGDDAARIIRIQDPAGKARTFAFDRGWRDIAEVDSKREHGPIDRYGENLTLRPYGF